MLIDEQLGYLIAFAEGTNSRPWDEWWAQHKDQLEREVHRRQYLRLKFHAYHEVCQILDDRVIDYEKSVVNANARGSRLPLNHDPIELDPDLKQKIAEAEERALTILAHEPRRMGFCHLLWRTKKQILRDEYGIDWKTPAEMNPQVLFD